MGWKNPFYRQKAKAYVHKRSGGVYTGKQWAAAKQVNQDTHKGRGNLPLPTSYDSTTNLHNYQNRAGEKRSRSEEFTYWLVRGCCTHWWGDPAGLEETGSPACGGRSRSRWAWGSRWGGGPALGCPSQPSWLKSTSSHKSDLSENTTWTTGRRVSVEPCDDLIPHRDTAGVDIPEDCQALFCLENLSAGVLIKMATVDLTPIKSCWLGACVCWGLSYWGNKDKRKPSGFFFYPSFLAIVKPAKRPYLWEALGGLALARPFLIFRERGLGGGEAKARQKASRVRNRWLWWLPSGAVVVLMGC